MGYKCYPQVSTGSARISRKNPAGLLTINCKYRVQSLVTCLLFLQAKSNGAYSFLLEPQEAKRRLDDVYRVLLIIGPILTFSFDYYNLPGVENFVYNVGYPFLIAAVFLWAIPHLTSIRGEYTVKLFGLILIWYVSFGLFFIIYLKQGTAIAAIIVDLAATLFVTYLAGKDLKGARLITDRTAKLMMLVAVAVALLTVPLIL